jgi:D-inositol-3-phosphate glycosyltransferase
MRALSAKGVEVHAFGQAEAAGLTEIAPGAFVHDLAIPPQVATAEDLAASADEFASAVLATNLGLEAWWSHYWIGGLSGLRLKAAEGKPWAHSAHTLERVKHLGLATPELPERLETEIAIVEQADWLVANTPVEKEQLVNLYGAKEDKVVVAMPGISPDWSKGWRLRAIAGGARLLYVGRLEPLKGPDIAIRAFAASTLPKKRGRLTIVGGADNGYERELAQLAKKLGVGKMVEFKGALNSRAEMLAVYAQADCLLATSRSESFGLAALEAQASGIPVVASDVDGLPYVVADNESGLLVPVGNVNGFAAALNRLWSESGLLERLSQGTLKQVARFSWETCVDKVLASLSDE